MKSKEIAATVLLSAMIIASAINVACINRLCADMSELVEKATDAAGQNNWDSAESLSDSAMTLWERKDSYTHVVLRHSEIDILSDALFDFYAAVREKNGGQSSAAAKKVQYHIESISRMEMPSFGSVF